MAGLFLAHEVAGPAQVEVASGQRHAAAQPVEGRESLETPRGRLAGRSLCSLIR